MSPPSQLEFVQLLTSHQGRLYAYVLSLVGDPDQARDVMQETNAVLWKKADEFENGSNFGAWMFSLWKTAAPEGNQSMSISDRCKFPLPALPGPFIGSRSSLSTSNLMADSRFKSTEDVCENVNRH